MAFVPELSTDSICVGANLDECLTDKLDELDTSVTTLQTGKAPANHTHGYNEVGAAPASHSHTQADVTGLETRLTSIEQAIENIGSSDPGAVEPMLTADMHLGKLDNNNGMEFVSSNRICSDPFPVAPGNSYWQVNDKGVNMYVLLYDQNELFLQFLGSVPSGQKIDVNHADAAYMRIGSLIGESDLTNVFRIYDQDPASSPETPDVDAYTKAEADARFAAAAHAHDGYAAADHTHSGYAAEEHTHGTATSAAGGFMSKEDKVKLDGMPSGGAGAGQDGKSAYQIAVENGFEGTQAEWLASLKGDPGEPGQKGDPGDPGPKGDPGDPANLAEYMKTTEANAAFAGANHTHSPESLGAASANHAHSEYAPTDHTHSEYAPATHNHNEYAPVNHSHNGYAASTHKHTAAEVGAAPSSHTHSGYASSGHSHTASEVGAAPANHSHSEYSQSGHQHTTMGSHSVTGLLRTQDIVSDSPGERNLGGPSNRWKFVYSVNQLQVGSDQRLKKDIFTMDASDLARFVEALRVVEYKYKDDKDGKARIGLIAQEIQTAEPTIARYFVNEEENGMLSLSAADLVFPLIAAVQELSRRVEELSAK